MTTPGSTAQREYPVPRDYSALARQFTQFYYNTFDNERPTLATLYRDLSMLSFEGQHFQGVTNIMEKLNSLPFQKVAHQINTIDVQPSNPQIESILIAVTGKLLIDEEQNPQQFSQTFHLIPEGPSSFWVLNDIFRLNYG